MKITINENRSNQKTYVIANVTEGSEKQIDWANDIKLTMISDIFMLLSQPGYDAKENQIIMYCDKLNSITSAKFWIENKSLTAKEILKSLN
jgi:hypothetical protein